MDNNDSEDFSRTSTEENSLKKTFCTVTSTSKYLAMILFIVLPFAGFWLGMQVGNTSMQNSSSVDEPLQIEGDQMLFDSFDITHPGTCNVGRECNGIVSVDCGSAADGPLYYVDVTTEEIISECGGFCMAGGCAPGTCPPPAYQCEVEQTVNQYGMMDASTTLAGEFPLIEKRASWGPCSTADNTCFMDVTFMNTGIMVVHDSNGTSTYELSGADVDTLYDTLQTIGDLPCDYEPILDYWATYTIFGREEVITYPGCEAQLQSLDEIVAKYTQRMSSAY